ncbi:potassium-transporting ATPase subunit KdpC [Streptacidiphilus sp. PB12-B1b]|uniref:potassium-transporting ATPase subunit KdpC n=1 Tax=Streptacidiphilus sp. PB12-B1b TaxID=2705012 RepID=UPI0015FA42E9|nr:potassium-transporting ATPase subunit KdpC [Streptacidiphilus sp. PB12-B1b]QMU76269.1 potassium-transporting ATPase subunit KdpC [Streptacidiphilus sp. PB12-B1b]
MAKPLPTPVRNHLTGLRILLLFTVVCGLLYPLAITGISQVAFSSQANGSLVKYDGKVVGSSLLGQNFTVTGKDGKTVSPDPKYFQSRPSAAGADGYDAAASAATNLGPNSAVLVTDYTALKKAIAAFDGVAPSQVPPDAVTSSGSGLDPDISPQYAAIQVDRVARARDLPAGEVRALVTKYTQGRTAGFLGQPRVDVLDLNIALAKLG